MEQLNSHQALALMVEAEITQRNTFFQKLGILCQRNTKHYSRTPLNVKLPLLARVNWLLHRRDFSHGHDEKSWSLYGRSCYRELAISGGLSAD